MHALDSGRGTRHQNTHPCCVWCRYILCSSVRRGPESAGGADAEAQSDGAFMAAAQAPNPGGHPSAGEELLVFVQTMQAI